MQHKLKFTTEEKINAWLELCEFTFKLCKSSLLANELDKRFKKLRKIHREEDYLLLTRLARIK